MSVLVKIPCRLVGKYAQTVLNETSFNLFEGTKQDIVNIVQEFALNNDYVDPITEICTIQHENDTIKMSSRWPDNEENGNAYSWPYTSQITIQCIRKERIDFYFEIKSSNQDEYKCSKLANCLSNELFTKETVDVIQLHYLHNLY